MLNCNLMICELHYDRFVYAVIYIYWWICDLLSIVIIASLMSRLNFLLSIDPSSKWMITITSWWLNGYAQILLPSSINIVVTILLLCRLTIFFTTFFSLQNKSFENCWDRTFGHKTIWLLIFFQFLFSTKKNENQSFAGLFIRTHFMIAWRFNFDVSRILLFVSSFSYEFLWYLK